MSATQNHRLIYLEVTKIAIILLNYLPYLFFLYVGERSWIMLISGLYLALAMFLRNFPLHDRLPVWAKTVWLLADTLVWVTAMRMTNWAELNYAEFTLAADAVVIGWRYWRGVPHLLGVGLILMGGQALDWPGFRLYWGHFGFQVAVGALFVHGFVAMAEQMRTEREEAARAREEAEVAQKEAELANVQLREYVRQVEEMAMLRERNRLAREVHDTIAHGFTGMIMQLEAVRLLLEVDPAKAADKLETVQDNARDSLDEVRRSVHALRPIHLEHWHSRTALAKMVAEFAATAGVAATFTVGGTPIELPAGHELCLYRAAQEGLVNALRHGRATQVSVSLDYGVNQVVLSVVDNGRGDTGGSAHGLGLVGIQERAMALGGTVTAGAGEQGRGFVLRVLLPYL